MNCNVETVNRFQVVHLSGEVDMHYSPEVRQALLLEINNLKDLLVDLSQVTYIDSSGIACLVEGFQLSRSKKITFGLVGVSDAALQVIMLARLDTVFPIKESVAEYE